MIFLIRAEVLKLKGSLALLLAAVAPAFPALLVALSVATAENAPHWPSIFQSFMLPLWALFLLPMVIAAFSTLMAQIEYQSRGWDHLLALPIQRWQLFMAKAIVIMVAVLLTTCLTIIFTALGAALGGAIGGNHPVGTIPFEKLAKTTGWITASALFFVALQTWVALRFASFVVPLSFGIGGTMVSLAVAMTGTRQADWFPWVMPMKILTEADPVHVALPGAISGLAVLVVMAIDLSRRDFR